MRDNYYNYLGKFMNRNRYYGVIFISVLLGLTHLSYAEEVPGLVNFFQNVIGSIDDSVGATESGQAVVLESISASPSILNSTCNLFATSTVTSPMDENALSCQSQESSPQQKNAPGIWYFQNFYIRIYAEAGVGIPGIADVEVVPQAELYWRRDTPPGMTIYKN